MGVTKVECLAVKLDELKVVYLASLMAALWAVSSVYLSVAGLEQKKVVWLVVSMALRMVVLTVQTMETKMVATRVS